MTDKAKHAQENLPAGKSRSRADVWFVLITTGAASVTLQVWHAVHAGRTVPLIALLVGLVPAATAIGLSHVVASHKSVRALRYVTFAVMLASMAVSIGAIAAVVRPIEGQYFSWVFGLTLDAAALACVWVLLGEHERKAAEATALQVAESMAREAGEKAAGLESDAAEAAARSGRLEAELADARAALEALRSAAPASRSRRSASPAPKVRRSAHASADTQDLTTELRALQMLDAHPELRSKGQGGELARKLGVSPSYGRKLHARLTAEERPGGALQERAGERSPERTEERPS